MLLPFALSVVGAVIGFIIAKVIEKSKDKTFYSNLLHILFVSNATDPELMLKAFFSK